MMTNKTMHTQFPSMSSIEHTVTGHQQFVSLWYHFSLLAVLRIFCMVCDISSLFRLPRKCVPSCNKHIQPNDQLLSLTSFTPTLTETSPRGKSWTQITQVANTNHLDMLKCLRQSPRQTHLCCSNGT